MRDYQKLDVWRKAHALALEVHRYRPTPTDAADGDVMARDALRRDTARAARAVAAAIVTASAAPEWDEFDAGLRWAESAVDRLAYLLRFARDAGTLGTTPFARFEARAVQLRAMLGGLRRAARPGVSPRRRR